MWLVQRIESGKGDRVESICKGLECESRVTMGTLTSVHSQAPLFSGLFVALGNGDPETLSRNKGKPLHILCICKGRELRKVGLTKVESIAKKPTAPILIPPLRMVGLQVPKC